MSDVNLQGSFGGQGGSSLMFRNKLINGNFDVWQRADSQTASGVLSADRWSCTQGASTKTHSKGTFSLGQTEVPGNPKYYSSTTFSSAAIASSFVAQFYKVEDVRALAGKTVTLSFWAKADNTKDIAVEFAQFFGAGGSPSDFESGIKVQKFTLSTSWQKFEVTAQLPSIAGKVIGTDENSSTYVGFWFEAGSNLDSRTGSLGNQSGTVDIAQVQLEEGSVASPFEYRPYGVELSLCERYCQVWGSGNAQAYFPVSVGISATNGTYFQFCLPLRQRLRDIPTLSVSGNWRVVYGTTIDTSISLELYGFQDSTAVTLRVNGVAAGNSVSGLLTANNDVDAKIILSAEL